MISHNEAAIRQVKLGRSLLWSSLPAFILQCYLFSYIHTMYLCAGPSCRLPSLPTAPVTLHGTGPVCYWLLPYG